MIKYCSALFSLWLLLTAIPVVAQFTDNFEDGDFTDNPEWSGDDALFTVAPYNLDEANQMLRSNSPGGATYYLSAPSSIVEETSWKFFLNLQFGTSGANYVDVFLVSDDADLNAAQNGYFLRFGTTQDDITFWKKQGGSDELLIDGVDGQIGSSSNNPFSIEVTRNETDLWTVYVDAGATGNFAVLGSVSDADITSTVAFGFRIEQSSAGTPVNSHWFDDVEVAIILPDTQAPEVVSAEAISATEILVVFNEPLDQTSAEDVNNYNLAPFFGQPVSAELNTGNNTEVTLVFSNQMINGNTYELSVSGVEDVAGNEMEPESVQILFIIPEEAEYKEVVFNELMPDPNPPVNSLPDAEYIELYNASDKYFALENWELVNTTTIRTLPEHLLEPGAFVILCHPDNVPLFDPFGDVLGVASFVALTNSTDSLTLLNPEGEVIDVVVYSDSWYNDSEKAGGGWSLELINPETPCSGSQNWTASNDPNGGTPGEQNSAYDTTPDITPPGLTDFSIVDAQNILLFFSESIDPESVETATVTVDPSVGINEVSLITNQSIQLLLDAPIDTAVAYTITIEGITDCPGNEIAGDNSIEILIGFTPGLYEVLINEIMADPSPVVGLPDIEYIELYNRTDKLFDLSAANISGASFQPNTFIEPEGYLVLVTPGTAELFENFESVTEMQSMSSTFLTNSGKELNFVNASGALIDRVDYDLSWFNDAGKTDGGWSLERINPEEPCRAGDNWRASVAQAGGTPGTQNSVYDLTPDENGPQLTTILVIDSVTIELVFNETLDPSSVISAGYSFSPELTVFDIENLAPDFQRIRLTLAETLQPNQVHTIEIFGLLDCTGNEFENEGDAIFGRPGSPTAGNLIINEILFNQRTSGADFVEIYNNSNAIIGLQGWILGNLSNDQMRLITDEAYILLPGEYLAITDNRANILSEYPFAPPARVFQAEDIPTFNNSDGQVILMDPSGNTVDRFDYFEDLHFAMLNDVKGVSLERISFDRPSDDNTNWMSASEMYNWATPGFENSQFQMLEESNDEVSVSPEIFSPDNDGHQDVMSIHYQFDRSGLAGNITIYDSAGREIRRLMRNELLGTDGVISWDGTTDDGERARVGIHIIYMEVFTTDGYTKGYKRSCVVASRF